MNDFKEKLKAVIGKLEEEKAKLKDIVPWTPYLTGVSDAHHNIISMLKELYEQTN